VINLIGSRSPKICLYLDNKPKFDNRNGQCSLSVPKLITHNGNHWRKIFTIYAKLCCLAVEPNAWKLYRDQILLQSDEQINFSDQLNLEAKLHVFSGKSCWKRFNVSTKALQKMSVFDDNKVFYCVDEVHGLLLYTPYFDYRQFPNTLIEQVRQLLIKHKVSGLVAHSEKTTSGS
jgi:hypothetical protein